MLRVDIVEFLPFLLLFRANIRSLTTNLWCQELMLVSLALRDIKVYLFECHPANHVGYFLHWNSNFTLALCTLGNLFIWETTSYFQANDSTNFVQYVCLGLSFPLCTIFFSCLVSHCCLFSINLGLMSIVVVGK